MGNDVLVLSPQERDMRALEAAELGPGYRVRYVGHDLDLLDGFDPEAFLDEVESLPADAVLGTKDRSALLAAIAADRLGLPGPSPAAILACQHKPTSRRIQRSAAPEAVPGFALVRGNRAPFAPPFFVKPVVGRLSQGASRVDSLDDLRGLPRTSAYGGAYWQIARLAGMRRSAVDGLLAEQLLYGVEVTLEGYVFEGRVTVIGITDSVKYEGTSSFERFEYPTNLPPARCAELEDVVQRVLPALGFDGGFFNVEFFVPEVGPAQLVEVNARLASQFAPLVQAVHGRSTYEALVALHCGEDPRWESREPAGVAISYCVRVFQDSYVAAAPEPEEGVELLVRPGLWLSQQGVNDVRSYRLAIFTEVAETREEAVARCLARADALRFELVPPPLRRPRAGLPHTRLV